jgi:predicted  nucleic acid-binding Zn-ribbon protein
MSSVASNGAQTLKNFAVQFKSLMDLADALDNIGSLDNLAAEAQARMAAAKADADASQAEVIRLKDEIASLKAQAENVMSDANSYVAESEAKANADANTLVAVAKENAETINANAQAKAQKLIGDAGAKVTTLQDQKASLQAEILDGENQVAHINSDIAIATAKLQSIKDSIAKLAAA